MSTRSRRQVVRLPIFAVILAFATACASRGPAPAPLPRWSFDPSMIFPADRSFARPEDGIALRDGRLIIADQIHGLRLVEKGGTSRPFGDLAGAGYVNNPPRHSGAPNGVSLEPGGTHLLVADILGGGIYRVDVASGATERVYQHPFGVNTACRDTRGAIWFTQSTQNTPEQGEARMFAAVNVPVADGALWRLPVRDGQLATQAEVVLGGLYFANGLVLDEQAGVLYLAELGKDRVLRFRLDVATGRIDGQSTLLTIPLPDNLELDRHGRLWVTLPIRNELIVLDTARGSFDSVFHVQTAAQEETSAEFVRRGAASIPRMELLTPALWAPLPGIVTGVILGPDEGSVYVTGLGDALIRLER